MEDTDDIEFVATEHDRLISAVTKLDKTQHITEPTRNEPTNLHSEFNLIKTSNKLNIKNVVKILEDTAHHVQISKKLKKTQDGSKVLPKPVEKPQAERIKRATGYEQTKTRVGRWDPVVARNRTVDYVSFPLKHVNTKLQPTEEFLSKLKLKSSLEKELDKIDPPPAKEVEEEEEPMYPMSYEEMVVHRQHLAKLRAQQSYTAAKAKRQSKIKSKKYHRILKKEKLKGQLKEFEELQKNDPEEALKKLEAMEKTRALERHTLRHKNTGKWAKSKLVRAKYDKEVRQELAEQLAVSRGLTKKTKNVDSSDDEVNANENIPSITLAQDPMHPWMMQRSDKSNVNSEFDFGYKKYLKDKMYKRKEDSDSESDAEQESEEKLIDINSATVDYSSLKEGIGKLLSKNDSFNVIQNEPPIYMQGESVKNKQKAKKVIKLKPEVVSTTNWVVESNEDTKIDKKQKPTLKDFATAFESYETKVAGRVEKKLKNLRNTIRNLEKRSNSKSFGRKCHDEDVTNNLEDLKLKNQRVRPIIDEELIETGTKDVENAQHEDKLLQTILNSTEAPTNIQVNGSNIDTSIFTEVKPKYLHTALPDDVNDMDQLDDDEQVVPKVNIEEVFEEEDVVASFRQEKEEEINKDKSEDIDLSLPGWGTWGGKGVKASKRKRNRFIMKALPKVVRRDENKGDIIIQEYKDPKLASHKVSELPYPFTSIKEYEASIRAPLGNTFVPEKAHQKLIRPNVITKAGTIIEPMDEEELLVPKNCNYKNTNVISLISKK